MNNIQAVQAILPEAIQTIDGVQWFYIRNGGTFDEYQALPKVVLLDGKYFIKTGFNSDTFTVHYKNVPKSSLAFPVDNA
jgi:hypothetical protein